MTTTTALICVLSLSLAVPSAKADTLSFTGNLRTDAAAGTCVGCTNNGDYAQYAAVIRTFTLSTASAVSAVTFGYGGGVNAAGATIAQSGFESYLSLFDATGHFLSSTYFGTTCPAGAKTNTSLGGCYDVKLDAGVLAAGMYQIALSAYENLSYAENLGTGTLADGFTGLGNLYPGEDLHYAFDVTYTPSVTPPPSPVPEPASITLLGLGSVAAASVRLRLSVRRGRSRSASLSK